MKKILLIITLSFILSKVALSQWQYMMPVTVTENSGSTLYNYQLSLTVNTQSLITAGQMDANGNDIRFKSNCAGSGNLDYWIESGINTPSTVIWVRIDTLPASSTKTIFMAYGNPSAAAASTLAIFNGPNSATDSVNITNAGGVGDSQRGFRFAPTEDILVTSFGKNEPNGTTRFVTLFDFNTQAVVRQTQVSGPIGIYSYSSLSNPVWLTQNTQYVLELFQGTSDGYYYQTSSQVGQHLVYFDMRYCNGCTQNTFPTNVLSNYHYGLPDFWYYTKSNVSPAPTYLLGIPAQVVSVTAYPDTFTCQNGWFNLNCTVVNGFAPYTYSWTPATNVFNPAAAMTAANPQDTTTYYITVTDIAGCTSVDSMTVFTFPVPAVSISISPDTFCLGMSPITLTGGSPTGGVYSGIGVSNGMFYPDSAGLGLINISYTYSDSLWGCSDSALQYVYVDACANIQKLDAENNFEIYPTPAGSELRIRNTKFEIETIEIFNLPCQCVFSQRLKTNSQEQLIIDVSKLKPGIYFLKIQTQNGTAAKKFIKE
jgi:hypothetical protein